MGFRDAISILFFAALLFGFASSSTLAGDSNTAKFLLKHGAADVSKGKYEAGLGKLTKARAEDPSLLAATYWIAYAHEKMKHKSDAIREYRAFRSRAAVREGSLGVVSVHQFVA